MAEQKRYGIISADSHTYEGPTTYRNYIDPEYREFAPYVVHVPLVHPNEHPRWKANGTHLLIVPGIDKPLTFGLGLSAGVPPAEITEWSAYGTHPCAHDSTTRDEAQIRDGVDAEILFSSKGMTIQQANLPSDRKQAILRAYNRWLAEECARWPQRLFGLAMCTMKSVPEAIEDFRWARDNGCVGIMMPGHPETGDYDDPKWDPVWECAADLKLPLSFHTAIFKTAAEFRSSPRQKALSAAALADNPDRYMAMPRDIQDLASVFVLAGVLDRHPGLKIVASEGDSSWMEHFKYRLDKAYQRHGAASGAELQAPPSFYIDRQVYTTHQTDWVVFRQSESFNMDRIMWGSDFPHSDSTWPASPEYLNVHTKGLKAQDRAKLLRNNAIDCYNLPLEKAPLDVDLRPGGVAEYERATGRPIDGPTFSLPQPMAATR